MAMLFLDISGIQSTPLSLRRELSVLSCVEYSFLSFLLRQAYLMEISWFCLVWKNWQIELSI